MEETSDFEIMTGTSGSDTNTLRVFARKTQQPRDGGSSSTSSGVYLESLQDEPAQPAGDQRHMASMAKKLAEAESKIAKLERQIEEGATVTSMDLSNSSEIDMFQETCALETDSSGLDKGLMDMSEKESKKSVAPKRKRKKKKKARTDNATKLLTPKPKKKKKVKELMIEIMDKGGTTLMRTIKLDGIMVRFHGLDPSENARVVELMLENRARRNFKHRALCFIGSNKGDSSDPSAWAELMLFREGPNGYEHLKVYETAANWCSCFNNGQKWNVIDFKHVRPGVTVTSYQQLKHKLMQDLRFIEYRTRMIDNERRRLGLHSPWFRSVEESHLRKGKKSTSQVLGDLPLPESVMDANIPPEANYKEAVAAS